MIPYRLETTNLSLRPFSVEDAKAVFEYWSSDPGWARYNASVPINFELTDAVDFVVEMCARERRTSPNWAVLYQGVVVGVVSLTFGDGRETAVIGYGVHGELRGRGFAVEAAQAVIDQVFGWTPELAKVVAYTDAENIPSHRVLEKLGFVQREAIAKNQFVDGRSVTGTAFELDREKWAMP